MHTYLLQSESADRPMSADCGTCPFNFIVSEEHQTKVEDEEIAIHTVSSLIKFKFYSNFCE